MSYFVPPRDRDYNSAAVCRRGHVETTVIERRSEELPERCQQCGAPILTACPARIRGNPVGVIGLYDPPDFCGCGSPFPWASRRAIVYHIQNQLEEETDLAEGDRRRLEEQLSSLLDSETSVKQQTAALELFKRLAPKAWAAAAPAVQAILTTEIKRSLGLPIT